MVNVLTIDFEEWYHGLPSASRAWRAGRVFPSRIRATADHLLSFLERYDVRATFFVLGRLAEEHPDVVRAIAKHGHELAVHGYDHTPVRGTPIAAFERDVSAAKRAVEQAAGARVKGYRAPSFSMPRVVEPVFAVLQRAGFSYDSSLFPFRTPLYGDARFPRDPCWIRDLFEIPISTVRMAGVRLPFSGGVYFRLWPYGLIRSAIRRLNADGRIVVAYFHPWELDPNHPFQPRAVLELLTHYSNLRTTQARLGRMLAEFSFGPIRDVFPFLQ
jgi:polysaccharide deacetylase family protein (PEP-CTERM system associated)